MLDLRSSLQKSSLLETNSSQQQQQNEPASRFKKMPLEFWENVLQIGRAYKPNQPTECPIQTSGPTIDIYTVLTLLY